MEPATPMGDGGYCVTDRDIALIGKGLRLALEHDYPIDAAIRQKIVESALRIATTSQRELTRVAAMRVLLLADRVNVHRERAAIAERNGEINAATSMIRATLDSPQARRALVELSEQTASPSLPAPSPSSCDLCHGTKIYARLGEVCTKCPKCTGVEGSAQEETQGDRAAPLPP